MTEKEYKEHIHNAYCRIVIRHTSIGAAHYSATQAISTRLSTTEGLNKKMQ